MTELQFDTHLVCIQFGQAERHSLNADRVPLSLKLKRGGGSLKRDPH
ncbi:MAG: hypothetical protein JWM11_5648 [Planctomycetaceae bacterium]|nr:hypothetical protein [Planctomycetaceae bacterium]